MGANAGAAFSSNDELIAFMEQVNRQFTIGGASAQGQAAAMLQLTQAMAAGALRGEELNLSLIHILMWPSPLLEPVTEPAVLRPALMPCLRGSCTRLRARWRLFGG